MIVAVRAMGMMHMSTDDVIKVIPVRNGFMPAFRTVSVFLIVPCTCVVGRASVGVGTANGNSVLIDVAVMHVMHVTVMEIVRMPLVAYSDMSAIRTMFVAVLGVLCALAFFHRSPFDQLTTDFNQLNTERSCASGRRTRIRVFPGFPGLIFRVEFRGRVCTLVP